MRGLLYQIIAIIILLKVDCYVTRRRKNDGNPVHRRRTYRKHILKWYITAQLSDRCVCPSEPTQEFKLIGDR